MLADDCSSGAAVEQVAHAFEALEEPRRIYAILYLSSFEAGTEVELRAIAKSVAGQEHDIAPDEVDNPVYKSVRGALHTWHLPALDRCGAIEYDDERTTVEIRPELRFYSATLALVATWIRVD